MSIMLKKIIIFSFLMLLLVACSTKVPRSTLKVDNSICSQSIAKGVLTIVNNDLDIKNQSSNMAINTYSKALAKIFNNKEMNYLAINGHNKTFSFLIQKIDDQCWLRLYKIENTNSHDSYTNTLTFIESYKLKLCKCTENTFEVQIGN